MKLTPCILRAALEIRNGKIVVTGQGQAWHETNGDKFVSIRTNRFPIRAEHPTSLRAIADILPKSNLDWIASHFVSPSR